MDYSKVYFNKTGRKYLYNIMPIDNLRSVFKHGILSKNSQMDLNILAASVADVDVQERRDRVTVPNGLPLHSYANLYFTYWNPMLSRVRKHNREICLLRIDSEVLNIPNVVISDMNAAKSYARFYEVGHGLEELDYKTIFMQYWTDCPDVDYSKGVKCAEILIPQCVPVKYINSIVVANSVVKSRVADIVPQNIPIDVEPNHFFS